jgi:hypothetical protein
MIYKLEKVISGGQTGADQAGLRAAKQFDLATGGFMPRGWRTLRGPQPQFQAEYGMVEHHDPGYPARTESNVRASDGTIRFAKKWSSTGERCTLGAIKWINKPYIDVDIRKPLRALDVAIWLKDNNIRVVNIAGNAEETAPGVGEFTEQFLVDVFKLLDTMSYIKRQSNDSQRDDLPPGGSTGSSSSLPGEG